MATKLEINSSLSPIENIVALIHYTYPKSVGYIDTVNYTFTATEAGDLPFGNTNLDITALPSATLTGTKRVTYQRIDIHAAELEFSAGTVADYEASEAFKLLAHPTEWERTESVESDGRQGMLYTYTAKVDSLLFTGYYRVFIPTPPPETVEEVVDGESLDGLDQPL